MSLHLRARAALILLVLLAGQALAQTSVPFGGLKHDPNLPVEITADQLEINQADGSAVFMGHVVVGQGTMRLTAGKVRVEYAAGGNNTGQIRRLAATGGVTLVNGTEAAEADEATYDIDKGQVVMVGNVILTQGQNALSAERMIVDLVNGRAVLEGRVRSILQAGKN